MSRPFKKIIADAKLGGVCGGAAYALGVPAWAVRVGVALLALGGGIGFWAYLALWIFLPKWDVDPSDYYQVTQ